MGARSATFEMTSNGRIYLDYHATTPVDPRVAEIVMHYMTEEFGNANSSDHVFGDAAEAAVDLAREQVAGLVGAKASQVIFTSGATESVSLAIHGFLRKLRALGVHRTIRVALSPVEHKAVLRCCEALVERGEIRTSVFSVDHQARIDLEEFSEICEEGQDLVCLMMANNEVGNLYPVEKAAEIAINSGAFFLCDATQAVGKVPVRFREWRIDALTLSGHKFYGPKGVGALVLSERFPIQGSNSSSKDSSLRPGTQNVPGIAGLGKAADLRRVEMASDEARAAAFRDRLYDMLSESLPDIKINGDCVNRLGGNLHISVPGVPNHALIARVRDRLAVSTGSACSSGIEAPSHVLRAMGLGPERLNSALRIGLGKFTKEAEVRGAANLLTEAITAVQRSMSAEGAISKLPD